MEEIAWMFEAYQNASRLPDPEPQLLFEVAELFAQIEKIDLQTALERMQKGSLGNYQKKYMGLLRWAARATGFSEVLYFGPPTHGADPEKFVALYSTKKGQLNLGPFWQKFEELRGPILEDC